MTRSSLKAAALFVMLSSCALEVQPSETSEPELPVLAPWLTLDSARPGFEHEPALEPHERQRAIDLLRARGLDADEAGYYASDWVLVDDELFDARRVLRESTESIEKGYFWKNTPTVTNYQQIHVVGDPSFPPNAIWTWAFVTAGADWNAKTQVTFTTAAPGFGATVLLVQAGSFGAGNNCLAGFTTAPLGGQPGIVAINTTYNCTSAAVPAACRSSTLDGLSWNQKVHIATHEMGHALGFGHPADPTAPGVNHIAGTQSAANPNVPSYPSMMWGGSNGCFTGSGNVTLGLSADDVASANVKYP